MNIRPLIALLVALPAVPVAAQTPTVQTQLSLTASAYHDTQTFSENGVPGTPLAARLRAADITGAPDNSYGSKQFARAKGRVTATTMKLSSWGRASAWTQAGYYSAGAYATANAYSNVPFRMIDPALTGTQGTLVVPLHLTGGVILDTGFYDPATGASADGRAYMMLWASGLGNVDCGSNGANQCLDISSNASGTHVIGNGANTTMTLNIPFTWGDWGSASLQMWTFVNLGVVASGGGGFLDHHGESDFSHTLRWGGVSAVLDANGQAVNHWTIESAPGVNLAVAAVPEPGTWAMLAGGLLWLGGLGLSRQRGARS